MSSKFFVSERSRKGIIALVLILLFLVFLPRIIYSYLYNESFKIETEQLKQLETKKLYADQKFEKKFKKKYQKKQYLRPPTKFNPNNYTQEDWVKLGLSEKQAQVILNYAKNGLYSSDQVDKIFVMPEKLFALIKDSLYFDPKPVNEKFSKDKVKKEIPLIEINTASIEELEELNGIGPFFAKQIAKYRDQLGGFTSKSQMMEVWKMDEEKLSQFSEQITVSASEIKKLNINTADAPTLALHPYIDYKLANAIVKYREQHNDYQKLEDLKEIKIFDQETFLKLKPYLTL